MHRHPDLGLLAAHIAAAPFQIQLQGFQRRAELAMIPSGERDPPEPSRSLTDRFEDAFLGGISIRKDVLTS